MRHSLRNCGRFVSLLALTFVPSGNAWAQTADKGDVSANDIVITAQKRAENLQNVPLSVLALDGNKLKERNLTSIADMQVVAPGVSVQSSITNVAGRITIRGIGTQALTEPTVEQSVSVALDGVTIGAYAGALFNFNDIERIEVLRGPQGMLFGKGASNGVINVVSAAPTNDLSASFGASYGTLNEVKLRGTISGGLTTGISARLSAYRNVRDGLGTGILPDGRRLGLDNVNEYGVKGQLKLDPTDDLRIVLSADYSHSHSRCCAGFMTVADGPPGPDGLPTRGQELPADYRLNFDDANATIFENVKGYGVAGQINYALGDYNLTSITAWRRVDYRGDSGNDLVPATIFKTQLQDYAFRQFSQELRVTSPADQLVSFTAGLFYYRSKTDRFKHRELFVFPPVFADTTTTMIKGDNYAAFGQATINVTKQFRLIAGARITRDKQMMKFRNLLLATFLVPNPLAAFLPPPFNVDPIAPRLFQANDLDARTKTTNLSYKVGAQYDVTDDVNVFATYSKGFKASGFLADSISLLDPSAAIVRPEIPLGYEIGFRSRLLDRRLTFNLTWFDYYFHDLQSNSYNAASASFRIVNANARTKGLELETMARLTGTTTASFNGAYTLARFGKNTFDQCFAGQTAAQGCLPSGTQSLDGLSVSDAPKWSFTANARQELPFANSDNRAYFDVLYFWRSRASLESSHSPDTFQDAYGRLDATVGVILKTGAGKVDVRAYARNLTKSAYATAKVSVPVLGFWAVQFVPYESARRVFGIAADFSF